MSPWGIRMSPLEEVRHSLQCCGMILPAMGAYVDVVNYHMEKIRPIRLYDYLNNLLYSNI